MQRKSKRQISIVILLSAILMSCSQVRTRNDSVGRDRDDFKDKPEAHTSGDSAGPMEGVKPEQERRVAVILGPGGYKAFAHTGVIKELRKQNVPIHAIAGVEWGALIAGLYAQHGQINEAEWKLYKLDKMDLDKAGFFGSKPKTQSIQILEGFLKENLDVKEMAQASVPFYCPSLTMKTGILRWQDRGSVAAAVENCLASPPLFTSEKGLVAALFSVRETALRLRKEGYNVILLVNVLGAGNLFDNSTAKDDYPTTVLWNEVRRAIWEAKSMVTDVIDVDTREVDFSDFDKRKMVTASGEAAGEKAAKQLASKYGF